MTKHIPPQIIRQIFVILLILLMGSLIFRELLPYLTGVLGAVTIYVLMRKWMAKLVNQKKWNPSLAAAFLMLLSFVGILIPIAGIILMLTNKIGDAVQNSAAVIKALKEQLAKIEDTVGYDLTSQIDPSAITGWLSDNLQNLAGGTFNAFIAIGLMYFMLYYMFTNRTDLRDSLKEYIPMHRGNLKEIGIEVQAMVRSNALGIPLVAVAQGIVALIGFLIFGIEDPFFWFVIVTIGSMIPFVGTLVGILPVFVLTLSTGHSFQAWGILIYGFVVVGSTDNIIRLYVLKKLDNVHPLVTLIGVIVGVPLFGFIGLIFGPLLISLFMVIVRIYRKEYGKEDSVTQEERL
ncbi:MAG TPA: AI-2E family transporter [Aequorivita sp.]|nr:AI-2E family transporter [Aequorivita sp.]MBP41789.1 AI-2E family transporter [Aequorivita sp.]HBC04119.1 AI-2E family transporter [Aequorivita sp.]HNP69083.1 AI-2E family transporter [Aequorivita sp.]|tara:strand:+ start:5184 stop:6224 length:1041 start_codon:yes stop_codon:yes gene_type:complete